MFKEPIECHHYPGFYIIPTYENYIINKAGIVKRINDNQIIIPTKSYTSDKAMVSLRNYLNLYNTVSISYILSKVFIPLPKNLTYKTSNVFHKDRNKANHSLDNLEWKPKNYERVIINLDKFYSLREKFNFPYYEDVTASYYPNAVEYKDKEGFYYISKSDRPLLLSKEGKIFDLETNTYINSHKTNTYVLIALKFKAIPRTMSLHRLLALMFLPKPERHLDKSYSLLEVNHIDGNKENNSLNNLEWVTPTENQNHAIKNGLVIVPEVLSRNILTNEIIKYQSASKCAYNLRLDEKLLVKRLYTGTAGRITKDWCVFKYNDGKPWPELQQKHFEENRWEIYSGVWYAYNIENGDFIVESTKRSLASALKINIKDLIDYNFGSNNIITYKKWNICYDEDPMLDVYLKVNPNGKKVIKDTVRIKVKNLITLIEFKTDSINEAARRTQISASMLSNNLSKFNNSAVIKNYSYQVF